MTVIRAGGLTSISVAHARQASGAESPMNPAARQVAPPSLERNTPPESASTIAQTLFELLGETARPMLPSTP